MIRHVGLLIDGLIQQPEILQQSGIDNMVYRIVAMMLQPERFLPGDAITGPKTYRNSAPLLIACDYIHSNLDQCIELNDLAQVSGMSERNMQYLFRSSLAVRPCVGLHSNGWKALESSSYMQTVEPKLPMLPARFASPTSVIFQSCIKRSSANCPPKRWRVRNKSVEQ